MSAVAPPRAVSITNHAARRFIERVQPSCADLDDARLMLRTLIGAVGELRAEAPAWVTPAHPAQRFLFLGDDVCLVINGRTAVTCVTRASAARRPAARRACRGRAPRRRRA